MLEIAWGKSNKINIATKGLDANKDGRVTKGEAAAKVRAALVKGLGKSLRG